MNREYSIILPKNDNSGERIQRFRYEKYVKELSQHFGGVTIHTDIIGCYVEESENIQCEPNIIMKAVRLDDKFTPLQDKQFIDQLSKDIGDEFGQWGIMKMDVQCNADLTLCEWKQTIREFHTPKDFIPIDSVLENYI